MIRDPSCVILIMKEGTYVSYETIVYIVIINLHILHISNSMRIRPQGKHLRHGSQPERMPPKDLKMPQLEPYWAA